MLGTKRVVAAIGLAGAVFFGLTPARADVVFDFATLGADASPFTGDLGASTATFTNGGITITANGFLNFNNLSPAGGNTNLFVKTAGGNENGLGITSDVDHEISGTTAIQIALPKVFSTFSFQMGSVTGTEAWRVWGSNDPTVKGALLLTSPATVADESEHVFTTAATLFQFYTFAFAGTPSEGNTNVLLANVDVSDIPLPAALPLFATGLGVLGVLGWRRKRKAQVVA
jgi:hypothetical protein